MPIEPPTLWRSTRWYQFKISCRCGRLQFGWWYSRSHHAIPKHATGWARDCWLTQSIIHCFESSQVCFGLWFFNLSIHIPRLESSQLLYWPSILNSSIVCPISGKSKVWRCTKRCWVLAGTRFQLGKQYPVQLARRTLSHWAVNNNSPNEDWADDKATPPVSLPGW